MGKTISLASIAVESAATSMKLYRFALKHSVMLAFAIALVVMFHVRVAPQLAP